MKNDGVRKAYCFKSFPEKYHNSSFFHSAFFIPHIRTDEQKRGLPTAITQNEGQSHSFWAAAAKGKDGS